MTKKITLLTNEFIENYPDFPTHMNALGQFVYYRTYSRFLPEKGRRETWRETVRRAVEYNVGLSVKHTEKIGYPVDTAKHRQEAEELFDSMFNLRQFLSGRTMWIGGADGGVAEKYPLANFNCSFVNIRSWSDLGDLFYLLLVGTGVGFKCTKEFAANLAPIRTNTTLINAPYEPVPKERRLEHSKITVLENGYAKIYVGDSKEGWVESLRLYFDILTKPEYEAIHTVKVSYNSVRPLGERLNTFGGTASGHEPLAEMFAGIDRVLKNNIDPSLAPLEVAKVNKDNPVIFYRKVRPIHILDIGNLIGNNVVVGGVRRTAEIFLMDADDYESIFAKYGINGLWKEKAFKQHEKIRELMVKLNLEIPSWFDEVGQRNYDPEVHKDYQTGKAITEDDGSLSPYNFGRALHHRRMSNNSIAFTKKPNREFLNLVFEIMQGDAEPGFINLEEANRRRPNAEGLNPCASSN